MFIWLWSGGLEEAAYRADIYLVHVDKSHSGDAMSGFLKSKCGGSQTHVFPIATTLVIGYFYVVFYFIFF